MSGDGKIYPASLAGLRGVPAALYYRGSPGAVCAPGVAIIGTRRASGHGRTVAWGLALAAVNAGAVVFSGLAEGCDREAHAAALSSLGRTVAVLAHGLGRLIYPACHRALAEDIVTRGGALVTEYAHEVPAAPRNFVLRDRIQSALAVAVVLAESGRDGGSFHTLRFARAQGRPIFAAWSDTPGFDRAGAERARDEFGATLVRSRGALYLAVAPLVKAARSGAAHP